MTQAANKAELLAFVASLLQGAPWAGPVLAPEELRQHHLRGLAHIAGMTGLRESYGQIAVLAAMHKQTLEEIQAAFAQRAIHWTTIKGANYAWHLYPDPAHRPMSDLDLIVPDELFAGAITALLALGYRERPVTRTSRHAQTFARRPHELIDLHRSILQPWRSNAGLEDFWQRALPQNSFTGSHAFCQVDLTLVHIAHMARHEFIVPLISFVDLQRLRARLSQEEHDELEELLAKRNLNFASQVLEHLLQQLLSREPRPASPRMKLLLPSDEELWLGRHRDRKTQIARKLALFPSDAPALLAGFCARSLSDRWRGTTSRREERDHWLRWRR